MTTEIQRESAQVYKFPARGRFATDGAREQSNTVAKFASARIVKAASGSGWYHDAAIEEAERTGKN